MQEQRWSVDLPHSHQRLWALFMDHTLWPEYASAVSRVDFLWPGDEHGNGRLRRILYPLPFGKQGAALELTHDVVPNKGYSFTTISRRPGNDQTCHLTLTPLADNRTRVDFEVRVCLSRLPWRWFEKKLCRFIHQHNRASVLAASVWLDNNPGYHPELAAPLNGSVSSIEKLLRAKHSNERFLQAAAGWPV